MLPWLSLIVAVLASNHGIDVRSDVACPSAEAIVTKLALVLPGGGQTGDVAWVERAADGQGAPSLRVRLVRADGSVAAARRLVLQESCDEMADTVATVLAIWTTSPAVGLGGEPKISDAASPTPAAPGTPAQLWLGVGGGSAFVGGVAATGQVELVGGHRDSHARARLAAVAQTSRDVALGPGRVNWRRTHISLGLGWSMPAGRPWQVLADAGFLLGWLSAAGRGFAPNDQQTTFEYGVGVGARGQRTIGAWALWLECRSNVWPRPQRAILSDSEYAALPRFDIQALVGVSRALFR